MLQHEDILFDICKSLSVLTDMDIKFIDKASRIIFNRNNHTIPYPIQSILEDNFSLVNVQLENAEKTAVMIFRNKFYLDYVAAGIWRDGQYAGFVMLGPYLSTSPSAEFLRKIIYENNLPIGMRTQLSQFYRAMNQLDSQKINAVAKILIKLLHGFDIHPTLHYIEKGVYVREPKELETKEFIKRNSKEYNDLVEKRYAVENLLLSAIEQGDKDKVYTIIRTNYVNIDFSHRVPNDPLRAEKNVTLTTNTLFRKAAQNGGVSPIDLDSISDKFSINIERCKTSDEIRAIYKQMIEEYCYVVKELSLKGYSELVRKVIAYINASLEDSLTLSQLAEVVESSPSHISRQFKKEVGMNIIEYINSKRVNEAKELLSSTNESITNVALRVGYNEINYFTRVFKKVTGILPSEYKKGLAKPE